MLVRGQAHQRLQKDPSCAAVHDYGCPCKITEVSQQDVSRDTWCEVLCLSLAHRSRSINEHTASSEMSDATDSAFRRS